MEVERTSRELSPGMMIAVTLVAVFFGLQMVGPIIGFLISMPFYPGNLLEMTEALRDPTKDPEMKIPLFIMQGFATLIGAIFVPFLLLKRQQKSTLEFFRGPVFVQAIVLIALIALVSNVVNAVFAEWNQSIHFPESMSGIEQKLRSLEEQLTGMSIYLTKFDSIGQVIIAMIVIAVLPGIGEELVFRGIIQNELLKSTKSIHLSIWISAFIFGVFHMQFYGIIPRMMLGALFGYLYVWSGSLTMAILAHFLNNGAIVIVLYLNQKGVVDFDLESTESAPWPAVGSAMIITGVLLFLYKRFFENRLPAKPSDGDNSLSTTLNSPE